MNKLSSCILVLAAIIALTSAAYDEKIATDLARASYAAYCGKDTLNGMACGNNCKSLPGYQFLEHKEYDISYKHTISYYTLVNPSIKRFIVAFRGTSNVIQLAHEFIKSGPTVCNLCKTPGAKVSAYFLTYYDSVFKADFIKSTQEAAKKYAGYDFYITGHSLGGAFATIAAIHLSVEGIFPKEKLHLYTFGSPRVGNRVFAKAVVANVKNAYRIVHDKDVVPHIPPCITNNYRECLAKPEGSEDDHDVFFGWHISPEIFYTSDQKSYKICEKDEDIACSNSYSVTSLKVLDHKNYLGASRECKPKLFNLRLPSAADFKDMLDDSSDEADGFFKNLLK